MSDSRTELAIIGKSLDEILRRVEGAPQTPAIQQIAGRALAFRSSVAKWDVELPTDGVRAATLQKVLDIQIDLMEAGIQPDADAAPDSS